MVKMTAGLATEVAGMAVQEDGRDVQQKLEGLYRASRDLADSMNGEGRPRTICVHITAMRRQFVFFGKKETRVFQAWPIATVREVPLLQVVLTNGGVPFY